MYVIVLMNNICQEETELELRFPKSNNSIEDNLQGKIKKERNDKAI